MQRMMHDKFSKWRIAAISAATRQSEARTGAIVKNSGIL